MHWRIAASVKGAWEPTAIPKIYSTPAALSVRAKASPPVIFAIVEPPLPFEDRLARHGLRVLAHRPCREDVGFRKAFKHCL